MQYRNTMTNVIITTECECTGENWEPVEPEKKRARAKKEEPKKEAPEPEKPAKQDAKPEKGGVKIGPGKDSDE